MDCSAVFGSRFSTFEMQILTGTQKYLLSLWPERDVERMTDDGKRESSVHVSTDWDCQKIEIIKINNKQMRIDDSMYDYQRSNLEPITNRSHDISYHKTACNTSSGSFQHAIAVGEIICC
ncbi:hypothetical protein AMECASPLE_016284 [Ameca splendens]|uniref:Uncharacterized protein n=1 Tax=Ameca splendens TaxID=208324 RepID=A0ABV0Y208_9TELE